MILKPKYIFNFLLKINYNEAELKIQKTNPVLTQLNIENSTKFDEFLKEFFDELFEKEEIKSFSDFLSETNEFFFIKLNLIL
jgi:hypothetical protein